MVGVQFAMAAAFSTSVPFLPLYLLQMHVHPLKHVYLWTSSIVSITFLFAAALSPVWGALADRLGRKAMVVRSCTAVALFTALMGCAQHPWQLLAARGAMGIFSGFFPASTALVGTQVPEQFLGYSLGWMATAQLIGTLCGPLIGGALVDHFGNCRYVFWCTAVLAALVAFACWSLVHERIESDTSENGNTLFQMRQLGEVLRHPDLPPLLAVMLFGQIAALGTQPILPIFVRSLIGTVPWLGLAVGASFAVTGLADLLISPLLGKRSDRLGYRAVMLICLAGMAAFTLPQGVSRRLGIFLVLRFGAGAFLGGVLPTADAWVGRMFPVGMRGQAYGIAASANLLGMFLAPLLGGLVASQFGLPAVFFACACIAVLNWILVASRLRRRPTGFL